MMHSDFADIDTWVFDLDNTLYPPHMCLFDQIERKMDRWIMDLLNVSSDEAHHLRKKYWEDHGTTLAGLMRVHGMPAEPFLTETHKVDFSGLTPDPVLRDQIKALPGRKIVFTNGTEPYAQNVLTTRGLSGIFDAVYGVEHAGYLPKPNAAAFEAVFGRAGLVGKTSVMFEDAARNLAYPFEIGMKTVHIAPEPLNLPHITHHASDLSGFLAQVLE